MTTKLDEIIARNQRASRPRERAFVGIVVGVFILVIIGLAAFTDLGTPPPDDPPVATPPPPPRGQRVLDVPLGAPRRRRGPEHSEHGSGQGAQ
jgi:hypothetical protein